MTGKLKFIIICIFCLYFISSILYAQEQLKVQDLFEMSIEELMDVKITTAGKRPEKISEIPASVVVISKDEIEKYGYQTLAGILRDIPGLYMIEDYSFDGSVKIGVRGFFSHQTNKNILILVNGVKITMNPFQTHDFKKINVPVEAIERIEVIRGPMSVMYGSGAFFGVINIITHTLKELEDKKSVSISYGSHNTKKFFTRFAGAGDVYKFTSNISLLKSDGLDVPMGEFANGLAGTTENTLRVNEKYFDFNGEFKDVTVTFNYDENRNDIKFLYPGLPDKASEVYAPSSNFTVKYKKQFTDNFYLVNKFNYFQDKIYLRYFWFSEQDYGGQEFSSGGFDAEVRAHINVSSKINATFGFNHRSILHCQNQIEAPFLADPALEHINMILDKNDDISLHSFYTQVNCNPNKNIKLVGGVRLEQMPKYNVFQEIVIKNDSLPDPYSYETSYSKYSFEDISLLPRFAIIIPYNSKNMIKLLYGRAISRPSFFQVTNAATIKNEDTLEPEYVDTYELYFSSYISKKWTVSMSLFHSHLENLIARDNGFDDQGNYYNFWTNSGEVAASGIELSIKTRMNEKWLLDISGTYQNVTDKLHKNIDYEYCPEFLGYFKSVYCPVPNISVSFTGNYVAQMLSAYNFTPSNIEDPNSLPVGRIGEKTDPYFLLNMNVRADNVFNRNVYLSFKISNLLDAEVRYPATDGSSWAPKGTIGFGRSIFLSLGYSFK